MSHMCKPLAATSLNTLFMVSLWPQKKHTKQYNWQDQISNSQHLLPIISPGNDASNDSPIKVFRTHQSMIPLKFTQKTKEFMRLAYRVRRKGLQPTVCPKAITLKCLWPAGMIAPPPPPHRYIDGSPFQRLFPPMSSNPSLDTRPHVIRAEWQMTHGDR